MSLEHILFKKSFHTHDFFMISQTNRCMALAKVPSIYWGEIAQTPIEPSSIFIIRGGLNASKIGPRLLQALTPMAPGGAIYESPMVIFTMSTINASPILTLQGTINSILRLWTKIRRGINGRNL